MSEKEGGFGVISTVLLSLRKVPEIRSALTYFQEQKRAGNTTIENPIVTISRDYLNSLKFFVDLIHVKDPDLKLVDTANEIAKGLGLHRSSAATHGLKDFVKLLSDDEHKKHFLMVVSEASNLGSKYLTESISDLGKRMKDGSDLVREGVKVSDGPESDPRAESAIYGHAKGIKPVALLKFVPDHLYSRLFTALFKDHANPEIAAIAKTKDGIFGAMEELVNLRFAQGKLDEETYSAWTNPKDAVGMGWNNPRMQEVYKFVVGGGKTIEEFRKSHNDWQFL